MRRYSRRTHRHLVLAVLMDPVPWLAQSLRIALPRDTLTVRSLDVKERWSWCKEKVLPLTGPARVTGHHTRQQFCRVRMESTDHQLSHITQFGFCCTCIILWVSLGSLRRIGPVKEAHVPPSRAGCEPPWRRLALFSAACTPTVNYVGTPIVRNESNLLLICNCIYRLYIRCSSPISSSPCPLSFEFYR
jgi:hypothetical protein